MESKFSLSDLQPTKKQIHLDSGNKRRYWEEYRDAMASRNGTDERYLDETQFMTMWRVCFSHVRLRKSKRVSGKCWTCAYINILHQQNNDHNIQLAAKHLMIMHRSGLFMLERMEYKRRVHEAVHLYPDTTMSSIVDGASANHCNLPQVGPNQTLHPAFQQHLEGVLNHGRDFVMYRTFPHVQKSADLIIYCLLMELERWFCEKGHFPHTWYVQVDGGSENANKYMLACMEYLVIKRLVKKIVVTRLPVGHTHEVIIGLCKLLLGLMSLANIVSNFVIFCVDTMPYY
jgi:hypothetical protein